MTTPTIYCTECKGLVSGVSSMTIHACNCSPKKLLLDAFVQEQACNFAEWLSKNTGRTLLGTNVRMGIPYTVVELYNQWKEESNKLHTLQQK